MGWPRTDTLKTLIKQHYDRINKLEDQKYDLEYVVKRKDVEVHTQNYLPYLSTISFYIQFNHDQIYFTMYQNQIEYLNNLTRIIIKLKPS